MKKRKNRGFLNQVLIKILLTNPINMYISIRETTNPKKCFFDSQEAILK